MSRLRIVQLANFVSPTSGGIKTALEAMGQGYLAAGHDRAIVVPAAHDRWTEDDRGIVVSLRAPRVPGGYRLFIEPWRLREVLERLAPTSVEVSDKATFVGAATWAAQQGAGSLLFSHERLDAMLAPRMPESIPPWVVENAVDAWHRRLAQRFDAVAVASRFAEDEFARVGGVTTHLVPLGVDLETFRPASRPRSPDRPDRPQDARRPLRLVHAGRLSVEKRPDLAVLTALALQARGVPVHLDVYGEGPMRAELETMAWDAPVRFYGHVAGREELARRLATADIALCPAPGETFGLSILEALACGTPVVTADTGGGQELVPASAGPAGLAAAAAPGALATAVCDLAARPEAERRAAARAQAERYPWSRTVTAMLDLHTQLAGRTATGRSKWSLRRSA